MNAYTCASIIMTAPTTGATPPLIVKLVTSTPVTGASKMIATDVVIGTFVSPLNGVVDARCGATVSAPVVNDHWNGCSGWSFSSVMPGPITAVYVVVGASCSVGRSSAISENGSYCDTAGTVAEPSERE